MDDFLVREATQSDSNQIRKLIDLVGINPTGLEWRRFLVVASGDRVIGCGQIKPHGRGIFELASIAVHPEYRLRGVARAVIGNLLDRSPRPLYLMCLSQNGAIYRKFGFHRIEYEDMPRYFQRIFKLFMIAEIVRKKGDELVVMKLE